MIEQDTIKLLRECDAGVKMGVSSIDDVLDKVSSNSLKKYLTECKNEHEELKTEINGLLNKYHDDGKEPNPIAKGMTSSSNSVITGPKKGWGGKIPPLTTERRRPPLPHSRPIALALSHVRSNRFADDVPPSFVLTCIKSTVLQERPWVNHTVTILEGSPTRPNHPTVCVATIGSLLLFTTRWAIPNATR